MGEQSAALLAELLEDFDPEWWDICFDVCSAAYLVNMAKVFSRFVPSSTLSMAQQKHFGREYDFYLSRPKMVLVLLSTRWDGAYKDKDKRVNHTNQGRTGAAICQVLLANGFIVEVRPPDRTLLPDRTLDRTLLAHRPYRPHSSRCRSLAWQRAYELPGEHHRDFAGMQGSHLCRTQYVPQCLNLRPSEYA